MPETFKKKQARLKADREREKAARPKIEQENNEQRVDRPKQPPESQVLPVAISSLKEEVRAQKATIEELQNAVRALQATGKEVVMIPPEYRAGTPQFRNAVLRLIPTLSAEEHPECAATIRRVQNWKRSGYVKDVLDIIAIHMQQGNLLG